jgi:outer membrane protein assembly factor BamB
MMTPANRGLARLSIHALQTLTKTLECPQEVIMRIVLSLCLLILASLTASAENWPHWRGPQFNGSTSTNNLPTAWSRTENLRWSSPMPGPSAATPIIWEDHVFVSSTNRDQPGLLALSIDRHTGQQRWSHRIGDDVRKDERSTYAAPSPVTDGKRVIFFYGNGELAAFQLDGEPIWKRNIQQDFGEFAFGWTFSASPLLYQDQLILQVLQRDVPARGHGLQGEFNHSYLLAVDPTTGKDIWRHLRPSQAVAESREAFTSPIPHEFEGRKELLVAGGDAISGHDPRNGEELWRWGTWNRQRIGHWRLVPSPVAGAGIILACAPKRSPIYAVKAGLSGRLQDSDLAWVSRGERDVSSDVPTPAFYDGDFFVLSDVRKSLSRVAPATGQVKWTISTPGRQKYEASPTVADGKIYLINFDGLVVVVQADDGEILNEIQMAEASQSPIRSTISIAGNNLFIRTNEMLYCVGE